MVIRQQKKLNTYIRLFFSLSALLKQQYIVAHSLRYCFSSSLAAIKAEENNSYALLGQSTVILAYFRMTALFCRKSRIIITQQKSESHFPYSPGIKFNNNICECNSLFNSSPDIAFSVLDRQPVAF